MALKKRSCGVFLHSVIDPEAAYNPRYKAPEPTLQFVGTEDECVAYKQRLEQSRDAYRGLADYPVPWYEIRELGSTYRDTRSL
jgi:hypothetical protein